VSVGIGERARAGTDDQGWLFEQDRELERQRVVERLTLAADLTIADVRQRLDTTVAQLDAIAMADDEIREETVAVDVRGVRRSTVGDPELFVGPAVISSGWRLSAREADTG
jgi:hypothetical protein